MARWPDRLREWNQFSRLAWAIGLGFVVLHLLYNAGAAREQMIGSARTFAASTIDRALVIAELAGDDEVLARRLSSPGFEARLVARQPRPPAERWAHDVEARDYAERIFDDPLRLEQVADFWFEEPDFRRAREAGRPPPRGPRLIVVVPAGEQWLEVAADPRSANWSNRPARTVGTTLFALFVLAVVLFSTARVTRHFSRFVAAAERLGQGDLHQPIDVKGPREVRRAAEAFNDMQARVQGYLAERSAMLAAFSHDLRTLVTRVGLRVENQADQSPEARDQLARVQADLKAMTAILDEALIYTRDESSEEPWQLVDLRSLVDTLLIEHDLTLTEAEPRSAAITVRAQPGALSRALRNLIVNALDYGDRALVRLVPVSPTECAIEVLDSGSGIPLDQRERVLRPYQRLEGSRNRGTGGTGLGLAIVAQVARRHGGSVAFFDCEPAVQQGAAAYRFGARLRLPRVPA
ncbi:MAG: HAMP domain-containing sensor histidine kinase [Pseudomonadota bacterium]